MQPIAKNKSTCQLLGWEQRRKRERERWVLLWLHLDVVDSALRFSGNDTKLSLPPFLCHFTSLEFLNLSPFFNSPLRLSSLVFPSYCTHSRSSPPLRASVVIYLYLKAVMLFFFLINTYPVTFVLLSVLPPLFSCFPLHLRHDSEEGSNHRVLSTKLLQHIQQGSRMPTQPYHSRRAIFIWLAPLHLQ